MIFGKIIPRLALGFLLLSPLPLAGLAWLYTQAFERTLQQSELEKLSSLADKKADQINSYINERLNNSLLLSKSVTTHKALEILSALRAREGIASLRYGEEEQQYRDYYGSLFDSAGFYDLLLIDAAGNVVFSILHEPDLGSNLGTGPYRDSTLAHAHREAMALLDTQTTQARPYAPSGDIPAIFIVTPIFKAGKAIGTIALQLDLDKLTAVTSDTTGLGKTGETVLAQLDGNEALYVGPLQHVPDAAFRYRVPLEKVASPMLDALAGGHSKGITQDYAGVGMIGAWRYLPALRWGMVVKMDTTEAFAPAYQLRKFSLIALSLLLLASGITALFLGRALIAPIQRLITASRQIALGDLSQRAPVQGWEELRQLAGSFNHMTDQLNASYRELEQKVERRTSELKNANIQLTTEIREREAAEKNLQKFNQKLEQRVEQRTALLLAAKEEAERANHAKSEFLSRMSHELRTPMNAILGFSQILEADTQTPLSPDQHESVQEILRAGNHLLELINEVLDLARIESGRIDITRESIDVMPLIQECITLLQPLASQRQIKLTVDLDSNNQVQADRMRLRQIVLNLLSNAIKYNREAGSVRIHCHATGTDRIRIAFHDTGRGIPPEALQRLFKPFERMESAYDGIEGTGIGLALCKRLTNAMDGAIGVESVAGKGSMFWVEFPLAAPEAPAPESIAETKTAHITSPNARTLLYVEDNLANLRLVQKIISTHTDLLLLDANSAEQGLEIATSQRPDIILLDINLPGMGGLEALQHLKENPATCSIPVVAITANAMARDIKHGMEAGFTAYLTKPLDIPEFLTLLDKLLKQQMVSMR